jgi:hypothetical protein
MRIACDIDGCLAYFSGPFRELLITKGAGDDAYKLFDYEPPRWFWPHEVATEDQVIAAWDHILAQPEWWQSLPKHRELGGASRALLGGLHEDHELFFVTQRPNGFKETLSWLEFHIPQVWRAHLVLTPGDKVLALRAMQPDIVIEDNLDTLKRLPKVRTRILVDRPYNCDLGEGIIRAGDTEAALALAALTADHKVGRAA